MALPILKKVIQEFDPNLATVLYVEDCPADIALTKLVLERLNIHLSLYCLQNGQEVVELFNSESLFLNSIDLVLMDFHLPKLNGLEVLEQLQDNEQFRSAVVIMLSSIETPAEMPKARNLGARDFMIKPIEPTILESAIIPSSNLKWVKTKDDIRLYAKH